MSSNCQNNWLGNSKLIMKFSDSLSGFISIHDWHVTIHQNQTKTTFLSIVFLLNILSHNIDSLLSIISLLAVFLLVYLNWVFQYYFQCFNIIVNVIYNKNSLIFVKFLFEYFLNFLWNNFFNLRILAYLFIIWSIFRTIW